MVCPFMFSFVLVCLVIIDTVHQGDAQLSHPLWQVSAVPVTVWCSRLAILCVANRTRNNGAKLIVKHFNTSVAQHFYPVKITTTWNAIPSEVSSSRTVNSFKNSWTNTGQKIPQISELTGSNHRCRAQFKRVQTVVGQRFAGNGPNGLSCYYYFYYYYY